MSRTNDPIPSSVFRALLTEERKLNAPWKGKEREKLSCTLTHTWAHSSEGSSNNMKLLLLFVPLILSSSSVNSLQHPNLCSTRDLCCKHRDSGCVVQHVFANKSIDTRNLPCYCDHACLRLQDCCQDYREYCAGKLNVPFLYKSLLFSFVRWKTQTFPSQHTRP